MRCGWMMFFAVWLGLGRAEASTLTWIVEPRWRGTELAAGASVRNDAGQELQVTRLAGLVSGVALHRADGTTVRLEGQAGGFDLGQGRFTLPWSGVPDGDYVGLEFEVGLPDAVNRSDPGRWPAGHVLNPLVNGLHWSWQGGYVFLALEGRWREGAGERRGFSYHLATDARRMPVRFVADFKVEGPTEVRLALDAGRVLGGLRLRADDASESTHSGAGDELAGRLAAAVSRAWFWLEARPRPVAAAPAAASTVAAAGGTPRAFVVPAGFPVPELPADNPLTEEGIALGRALFADTRLSGNGAQSCASCHVAARAFGDGAAVSTGSTGARGTRNAMPLFNLAWHPAYGWDGARRSIREQAWAAIEHPAEMNARRDVAVPSLAGDAATAARFDAAFGAGGVTAERVGLALEQYLLTLVAADSKFDRALRGAAELTAEERRGFELFATESDPARGRRGADCFHCHGGALFTDFAYRDNGLGGAGSDAGRGGVTAAARDRGAFKTPSLRNVAVSGPYMHDGRFATLEDVVAHYDHGVDRTENLDPNLAKHPAAGLVLDAGDRAALVAFLRTLTDTDPSRDGP